jgi:hypothetical protein
VASSVESRIRGGQALVVAITAATVLSGCVSTQQKAAWLHVQNARIIASQSPTVVKHPGAAVRVLGVSVVRAGRRAVVAVRVANPSARPLADIPISVGVRRGHRAPPVYLNGGSGADYFATHLVSIPGASTEVWVLPAPSKLPARARLFAVAGDEIDAAGAPRGALPRLTVRLLGTSPGGRVRVEVSNRSEVPQPELQLYAVATADGRITAAGAASLPRLGGGHSATATVALVGDARGGHVEVEALPTLF